MMEFSLDLQEFDSLAASESCQAYTVPAGVLQILDKVTGQVSSYEIHTSGLFAKNCNDQDFVEEYQRMIRTEPFYGSIAPLVYVLSGCTVAAWLLLLLLVVAQRRRPVLQKFGALLISITLTITLALANNRLEYQYNNGYLDALQVKEHLKGSTGLKVFSIITEVVLWIAHLQVILKIFSRSKYRNIMAGVWLLVTVINTIIAIVADFVISRAVNSDAFASPVLVVLFIIDLLMMFCYISGVLYWAVNDKRYAFDRDILILSAICCLCMSLPVIFIVLEFADYNTIGWANPVKILGQCAASVAAWEWILQAEMVLREEQKKGVMGRRVHQSSFHKGGEPHDKFRESSNGGGGYDGGSRIKASETVVSDRSHGASRQNVVKLPAEASWKVPLRAAMVSPSNFFTSLINHSITALKKDSHVEDLSLNKHEYPVKRGEKSLPIVNTLSAVASENHRSEIDTPTQQSTTAFVSGLESEEANNQRAILEFDSSDDDIYEGSHHNCVPSGCHGSDRNGEDELPEFEPAAGFSRDDYFEDKR